MTRLKTFIKHTHTHIINYVSFTQTLVRQSLSFRLFLSYNANANPYRSSDVKMFALVNKK